MEENPLEKFAEGYKSANVGDVEPVTQWIPKPGEFVYATNYEDAKSDFDYKRVKYICYASEASSPHITYDNGDFKDLVRSWNYVKPAPPMVQISLQEISEKFGVPFNLIEIIGYEPM